MKIVRTLQKEIEKHQGNIPVIAIIGARQVGKIYSGKSNSWLNITRL